MKGFDYTLIPVGIMFLGILYALYDYNKNLKSNKVLAVPGYIAAIGTPVYHANTSCYHYDYLTIMSNNHKTPTEFKNISIENSLYLAAKPYLNLDFRGVVFKNATGSKDVVYALAKEERLIYFPEELSSSLRQTLVSNTESLLVSAMAAIVAYILYNKFGNQDASFLFKCFLMLTVFASFVVFWIVSSKNLLKRKIKAINKALREFFPKESRLRDDDF